MGHMGELGSERRDAAPLPVEWPGMLAQAARDGEAGDRWRQLQARVAVLEAENRRLAEGRAQQSRFLAHLTHELRTPLSGIIGFAAMLHDGRAGELSARQRHHTGHVLNAARHMAALVNEVLDLTRLESGHMSFHPEAVDLPHLVDELCEFMRVMAAQRGISIQACVDPACGRPKLDPVKLRQVLFNYLSNALKASTAGGAVLVTLAPAAGGWLRIEVTDRGCGIAPEHLDGLFSEYRQFDTSPAGREGSGLGLAVTRRLVEAQGGTVGVRSTPGEGSTFHALLPVGSVTGPCGVRA